MRPACAAATVSSPVFMRENKVKDSSKERGESKRKARHGEGVEGGGVVDLEYGFGFPSFRGELKTIDTEAESEADQVAAQALIANTTYMHTRS